MDGVAVTGVWSPTCARPSPPKTASPPCANATAVTVVLSVCPHFQLENAPRDMPLFGLLSSSVLLTIGLIANLMVITFQMRRSRRCIAVRLQRPPVGARDSGGSNGSGPQQTLLGAPSSLPFVTWLALADVLGCGLVFATQIGYSLSTSPSVTDPWAAPLTYMLFMGTITWLGLVETIVIGAIAAHKVVRALYPQRRVPMGGWCKGTLAVVVFGITGVTPALSLWCDTGQWILSGVWSRCPECQESLRAFLDCRVFMFLYCILTLTVIMTSCLTYAALSIFTRVHPGNGKELPTSNGLKASPPGKREKMFGIVFADTVCTTVCWTPLLIQSLINQEHSASVGPAHTACTLDSTFPQIALIPMLLHPIIYIIGCDEVSAFFHSSWSTKHRRNRRPPDIFDSPFVDEPSSRAQLTRSMCDNDSSVPSTAGRRSSVKRNVCFDIERTNRPRFFFADLWPGKGGRVAKRKPTRYWKRYSCSSEPMSLFSSSSSSSINHMHQIASGPLPDAMYKRERIARRSSAFKSSSNVSSCTPTNSSGRECAQTVVMFLADENGRRRCSF